MTTFEEVKQVETTEVEPPTPTPITEDNKKLLNDLLRVEENLNKNPEEELNIEVEDDDEDEVDIDDLSSEEYDSETDIGESDSDDDSDDLSLGDSDESELDETEHEQEFEYGEVFETVPCSVGIPENFDEDIGGESIASASVLAAGLIGSSSSRNKSSLIIGLLLLGVVGLASYIIWNKIKAMKEEMKKLEMQQNMGLSDKDVEKITQETINNFVERERENEIERQKEIENQNELEQERMEAQKLRESIQMNSETESENHVEEVNEIGSSEVFESSESLINERTVKNPYELETINESDSEDEVEIIKVVPGTIEVKVKEESINDLISGGLIFDADIEPENMVLTSENDLDLFSAEELTKELENATDTEKESVELQSEPEPVKKRRGRPRKTNS